MPGEERKLSAQLDRTLLDVLRDTKVSTIVGSRPVVFVSAADTLGHAFEILTRNKVLSAPVRDPHAGKITGIIDMFDILTSLLQLFKETKNIATPHGVQHWTHWINDLGQMIQRGESLSHAYVYMHVRPHPPPVVGTQATLPAVMQHFHSGHHRVLVSNENGEIVAVLSQSQVLYFLAANIHLVDARTAQLSVSEAGLGKLKPHSITPDISALHGFDTLHRLKVHALPVVDRSDVLLGNLSIADLRAVPSLSGLGPFLSHTVAEYITNFSQVKLPPLTCRGNTTIETVILKMAAARVLRLWCVDEQNHPVGVVALSDLMSFLFVRLGC